jgi:tRNA G10  N-methylase Trm11
MKKEREQESSGMRCDVIEGEEQTRKVERERDSQQQSEGKSSRSESTKRSCRCMFCGDEMVLGSEEEAIEHMERCPALQEQLNDSRQFTLPESIKPTVLKK